jgi:thiol-disulfide isomerase/thioredoxin
MDGGSQIRRNRVEGITGRAIREIGGGRSPAAICLAAALFCAGWTASARADSDLDLKALQGRVVYLDFWASWCAPCRQSFPWMKELSSTYEKQGLTVVAIDVEKNRLEADKFLASFQPNFDVRFDAGASLAQRFNVHGMPTSVLIDRRGVVRFTHIGFRPIDGAGYEAQIRQLLSEE